ncbi:MAG TPA: PQQ-binding-like beta-propeller repeat protein [Candidatus Bathyarchaeia archaeon]|nr:PQQ-binding-like beta-propeller repeat protein [Candidatus Bathyarchaeia archaeon]
MKTSKQKIATAISLFLVSTIALTLVAIPLANAQRNPGWNITTFAYINAAPNPVGVGQKVDIIIWVDKPRVQAALSNAYRMHKYNLTIVDSANTVVLSQFWEDVIDPTSSQYYAWTPTAVGNYTLMFAFHGFKASAYPTAPIESNDTYLPSSTTTTLTVQTEPLPDPITSYPLPQEYWTRPIYGENTDWWSISSNWLGTGSGVLTGWGFSAGGIDRDPTDGIGPQTGHIMWTKPLQPGGVVGGTENTRDDLNGNTWFEGSAYSQRYQNPIIVAGMLIYNPPLSFTGTSSGPTTAVDIRTGKIIWQRADVPPISFAYIYDVEDPQQHGVYPAMLSTANFARIFDAYTGEPLVNVTGVPSGTQVLGPQGEYLRYVLSNAGTTSSPNWRLLQWNSTLLWTGTGWSNPTSSGLSPAWDTRTITTTTNVSSTTYVNGALVTTLTPVTTSTTNVYGGNGTTDTHSRYDWNVTIPWRNTMPASGSFAPSIVAAFYNDMILFRNGSLPGLTPAGFGPTSQTPYSYFGVSLKPATLGNITWIKTYTPPPNNITVVGGVFDPVSRVFTETYKETTQHVGYDLDTGDRLWTTQGQAPLDYYGNPSIPWIASLTAYGKLYSSGYGGIIYAYDMRTGDLVWTYGNGGEGNSTNSFRYLAYGHYPTFIGAFGSGMVYAFTAEHTVNTPIYKGALARGINATDGTEIWTLSNYDGSFFALSYAIADGFATLFNGYDNQIYSIGRGPSVATVSAPDVATPFGTPVIIKGTVMDISAGTQQDEQAARFPKGVPVVSDESMTEWMGYIYQQKPRPSVTGVDVTLSVLDSNGNSREIGTVTTDSDGFFSYQWTPEISGKYIVTARFAGTQGYWPSRAETAFGVMEAPAPPAQEPETPPDMTSTYIMYAAIGIIIAIVIVGAILAVLVLKRR